MNRAALLKRLEQLESLIGFPPTFEQRVLRTATDEQLDRIEVEIELGVSEAWDALVASFQAGESVV